ELLYLDLIDYVANEFGAEKMEAIDNIINTFKKNPYPWSIDDEIEVIIYEYRQIKAGKTADKFFKPHTKADTAELEQINKYYSYFYQGLEKSLNNIIDNYSERGESLQPKVKELIAKKEA
ncbi:MAG: hypothetical protein SPI60_00120, partial [Campylobacter lanienae]|nr:hypothetical protein [Campylobacter lanienae]